MLSKLCMLFVCTAMLVASPTLAQGNGQQQIGQPYQIGPEDVLEIVVWKNPELSRTVPVRPDGMISLPLVNDVKAAGLSPMQLRDVLITRLKDYIPNAEVSVIISEINSPKVSVFGQAKQGRYVLRSRTTILDFLAQIGGLDRFAAGSKIIVLRSEGNETKRLLFNYKKAMNGDTDRDAENFYLQPGDIIMVPKGLF